MLVVWFGWVSGLGGGFVCLGVCRLVWWFGEYCFVGLLVWLVLVKDCVVFLACRVVVCCYGDLWVLQGFRFWQFWVSGWLYFDWFWLFGTVVSCAVYFLWVL